VVRRPMAGDEAAPAAPSSQHGEVEGPSFKPLNRPVVGNPGAAAPRSPTRAGKERSERERGGKKVGRADVTCISLLRQPAWRNKACHAGLASVTRWAQLSPRQLGSAVNASVAPLVTPVHVARQSVAVAPLWLARPKGLHFANSFFSTVIIKILVKKGLKIKKSYVCRTERVDSRPSGPDLRLFGPE
jgi:hypothetical protein